MGRWSKSYKPSTAPVNLGAQAVADWLYRNIADVSICGLPEGVHHATWHNAIVVKAFGSSDPDWAVRDRAIELLRQHPRWSHILLRYQDRFCKGDRRMEPLRTSVETNAVFASKRSASAGEVS